MSIDLFPDTVVIFVYIFLEKGSSTSRYNILYRINLFLVLVSVERVVVLAFFISLILAIFLLRGKMTDA